ncbi:MAG: S46 family peptidase, partial [Bacteroidales bacterium]
FSMFRIYAGKDNKPAPYSPENVPYKPRHYLPISIKGVQEGDFTMVYGFPGSTNRFETSFGVKQASDIVNPAIVALREMRLQHWKTEMDKDEAVKLKLASSYAGIANYWKYYIGQTEQLLRRKVYEQKQEEEAAFSRFFAGDTAMSALLPAMKVAYSAIEPYALHQVYMSQGLGASSLLAAARSYSQILPLLSQADSARKNQATARFKTLRASLLNSAHLPSDQRITATFLEMYYRNIPTDQQPDYFEQLVKGWQDRDSEQFAAFAQSLYERSLLTNDAIFAAFAQNPTAEALENDPAYLLATAIAANFSEKYQPFFDRFQRTIAPLRTKFVAGKLQMAGNKLSYPDANSTLRITYGSVLGYNPRDAVSFSYRTTLDGVMEKEKPGDEEFDVPAAMKTLYEARNFGPYAGREKMLPVNFLTNNDITGGNSGSPVLNAKGELLGLAFDGNWEAMSGDIAFDSRFKRCISVDIRYVLFLIDTMGGASHLIEEMDIIE